VSLLASPPRRWCSFRLGEACFAVDTAAVVEVLQSRQLTRVPLAADGVLGLVHLRGRIVPVIDPAASLGVARDTTSGATTNLVIELGDDWYGLRVDEMLDVIEIPPGRVEHPTAVTSRSEAVVGTFAAERWLIHLLEPEQMIHSLVRLPPHHPGRLGGTYGGGS
jgi:purine-binding chemotaxis protein CheW